MSEPIKPALTPEEWAEEMAGGRGPISYHEVVTWEGYEHAIAAVALYGQPFGFTREDVRRLREVIHEARISAPRAWKADPTPESLADRIEALLPPEK